MKSLQGQIKLQEEFYRSKGGRRPLENGLNLSLGQQDPRLAYDKEAFQSELESLKGVSREEKIRIKEELTDKYRDLVEAFLESEERQNKVFAWILQWQWDLERYDPYFEWVKVAIEKETIPAHSRKDSFVECLVYDVLEWANRRIKQRIPCSPHLERMIDLVPDWASLPLEKHMLAIYLRFHDLLYHASVEEALEFGKIAYRKGAKVKTKLRDLFLRQYGEKEGEEKWKSFRETNNIRA